MSRLAACVFLAAFVGACCQSAPGEEPDKLPEARNLGNLPPIVRSAELHFTPDSKRLVVLRHIGDKNEPHLTVHNVSADRKTFSLSGIHGSLVGSDLFGPDELASDRYGRVRGRFRSEGVAAVLRPDGKVFLTASYRTIRLWETDTGRPIGGAIEHGGSVAAAFTRDGKRLVTFALTPGRSIRDAVRYEVRVRDGETGKPLGEPAEGVAPGIRGPLVLMKSLLWTPDERQFVTAYGGQNSDAAFVQFWDAESLKPVGDPLPAEGDIHWFGRDGKTLLVVSRRAITFWDIVDRKVLGRLETPETARSAAGSSVRRMARSLPWFAVHPEGRQVLYRQRGKDGQDGVGFWDLSGEKPVEKLVLKHSSHVNWIAISPDGKAAATANGIGEILVWNLETGRPFLRIPRGRPSFQDGWGEGDGRLLAVEFSPDGRMLVVAEARGVAIWSLEPKE
jgi:WD40 repeat protein